ncbi:mitochondrial fission factor homolog A-like [Osmerus eperlanus]|uniref:mitochondrial fission factor homolog A-like n=1 Tax=Osmerus eperlanus TaxID=29151 RepID=UPI002E105ED9
MSVGTVYPAADEAEMSRIHYELEYTEGISQRMRIPDTLKMGPEGQAGGLSPGALALHPALMHVPERIVISGDDVDSRYSRPRDLDLIQATPPLDLLGMKAPPRVLTLTEQPLDSLETDPAPPAPTHRTAHSRSRKERSATESPTVRHSSPAHRADTSVTPSPAAPVRVCPPLCTPEDGSPLYSAGGVMSYIQATTRRAYQQVLEALEDGHRRAQLDMTLDMTPDDSGLVDASTLRRQIVKLNRRLQLLEEENKERSRRELLLYSATVAFWLLNTWVWFRR